MKMRNYLIQFSSRKNIIVLIASTIITCVCFISLVKWLTTSADVIDQSGGIYYLRYYTLLSNLFAALMSTIIVSYAIDGIKKKRYVPSPWAVKLQYCGVICTTITMVIALGILLPFSGKSVVTGVNFFLHVMCPILQLILFFLAESNVVLKIKDMFLGLIPFYIYGVVYVILVFFTKIWPDLYCLGTYVHPLISIPVFMALGTMIGFILRILHNKSTHAKQTRLISLIQSTFENNKQMMLLEAYGLGTDLSCHSTIEDLNVPTSLFELMSEICPEVSTEKLAIAYVKGAYIKSQLERK